MMTTPRPGQRSADPAQAYAEHRSALFNYFRRCGLPRPASEDLTQTVFVALLESPGRFDPRRGSLRSFLFGIARNQRLAWRRRHPATFGLRDGGPRQSGPEAAVAVREAVGGLPDELREALILREFHGFDYAEIGRLQGVPIGTVRSRLFRARDALRLELRGVHEEAQR